MSLVNGRVLFSVVLLVCVVVLAGVSLRYNPTARAIPLIVCLSLVCLVSVQALLDVKKSARDEKKKQAVEGEAVREGKPLSLWRIFSWVVALIIGLALLNYLIVVPLFTFLFIWREAKARVVNAFAIALGSGVFYYLVFSLFLDITLPR
jgi:hypothetical protein